MATATSVDEWAENEPRRQARNRAMIGAPALFQNRGTRGAAVITDLTGNPEAILTSPLPGKMPGFGWSVAISKDGTTAYIGDPYVDRGQAPGRVYQFRRSRAGLWKHRATFQASNAERADEFGVSLALSDDGWLLVGSKTKWAYLIQVD